MWRSVVLSLGLLFCFNLPTMAQQRRSVTNEDFTPPPKVESKTEKSDKDTADKEGKGEEKPVADKEKAKKEETWQKKFSDAKQKTSNLDRQRTDAEILTQQLREQLKRGGDPQEVETVANQLRTANQRLSEINGQYDEAKKNFESMQKEGTESGYKDRSQNIPKEKNGRPNQEYYTTRYKDLIEQQTLAAQKLQLYQTRINEARQRAYQGNATTSPSRVGNPYYTNPEAKSSFEEAQKELQKIQQDLEKSNKELEQLQRDARNVGIPLR